MAVESSPQKGTLRIQQPARPRQLEKPTQACTTKTIKAEIYRVEDDRETFSTWKSVLSPAALYGKAPFD